MTRIPLLGAATPDTPTSSPGLSVKWVGKVPTNHFPQIAIARNNPGPHETRS